MNKSGYYIHLLFDSLAPPPGPTRTSGPSVPICLLLYPALSVVTYSFSRHVRLDVPFSWPRPSLVKSVTSTLVDDSIPSH